MKIFTLVLLCFLLYIPSHTQDLDTVWTHNLEPYEVLSYCSRFMPDGKSIIAGVGNTLYEFETTTGKLMRKFDSPQIPNEKNIISLEISYNGKTLVGKAYNGEPYYWSYEQGKCIDIFSTKDLTFYNPYSFIFHPFENSIFAIVNDTLLKYDFNTLKSGKFAKLSKIGFSNIAISKDAKYIALSYDYKSNIDQKQHSSLELWDVANLKQIKQLDDITRDVRAIAFSPSGKYVAFTTGQDEGQFLRLYNLFDGTNQIYPRGFFGFQPWGIVFSKMDNYILVSGGFESSSKLLQIDSSRSIYTIKHGAGQYQFDININNEIVFDELWNISLISPNWFTTSVAPDPRIKMNGNMKIKYMNEVLNLDNMDSELIKLINIFDINGKLVKTYDAGYSGATVDLPFAAPAGVYLIRIVTDQSDYNFKFVGE